MPGRVITLDTVIPGSTRRRVWAHPDVTSHSLVALTFSQLYLAPPAGTPKGELVAAVEAGGDLDALLGPLAVVVELIAVRRLRLDLATNALVIEYVNGLGTSRLTVTFATPEAADACFTKVWRRLGDGCQLQPYQGDGWTRARAPLLLLLGALLGTALLALVLSAFEDAGTAPTRAPAVGLNWQTVCAAGGVLAGLSQVWLYRRLTAPPSSLEVLRT